MKIRFRQSGGFAGLTQGCEVDTDTLQEAEKKHWLGLVPGSVSHTTSPPGAADLNQYEIQIEDGKRRQAWQFDDLTVPKELQALLVALMDIAKPQRP